MNWDGLAKFSLPIIIPVIGIIIFKAVEICIKSLSSMVEGSYGLGYKLGGVLEKLF